MELIASVYSDGGPQPGQGWRSSGDFSLRKSDYRLFEWQIKGTPYANVIMFDVAKDVRGSDPKVLQNIVNGDRRQAFDDNYLYIGGVRDTGGEGFTVEVYGIR